MQDVPQLLLLKTLSLNLILNMVRSCYFISEKLLFSEEIPDSEKQFKLCKRKLPCFSIEQHAFKEWLHLGLLKEQSVTVQTVFKRF